MTGEARDAHDFACLIGFGASAVNPYLAIEQVRAMAERGDVDVDPIAAQEGYRSSLEKGLLKIMSKMGISSIQSYRGAQLFEIVGIDSAVVDRCFHGTTSRIQGANFEDLWDDQKLLAKSAWEPREPITQGGLLKYVHGGEYHCYNPDVVATLQASVRSGDYDTYLAYAKLVNERPVATLRDLMTARPAGEPVPLEEVEPVEDVAMVELQT